MIFMGKERWVWGLGAVAVVSAALVGAFWLTLGRWGSTTDPGALFAGVTGALAGIVGAYFGVAAGGSAAQAVSEAKTTEAHAIGAMAQMARLIPSPLTDLEKATAAEEAISSVTDELSVR